MDFPQVQAAIIDICPEAEQARRALRTLLPELSSTYCCNGDAEAWGLLGNIGPQKIADLSGLDIRTSQLLKDRAKRQQYGPSVEVVPTDDAEKLRYLLGKEGFEYVKDLGSGGFGQVLLCRNTKLNRDVAIKVLTNLSERAKRQFASEATNLASLHNHPNIVQIHSAFERMLPGHAEPFKFIQMEYVRDGNLKQRLDQHKFTHAECMQCFLQLISTVKYLHGQRMLHCDIKPENVLLGKDHKDGSVLYKLADFGLSKDESMSATTSSMTSSIVCAGTRFYMSPERLLPPFTPSFASDVWSLALLFLEVASGHPAPFFFNPNGKISVSIIHQHCPREFRDILTPCFEEDIKMRCCDLKQLEKAMVSKMFDVFISYRVATENDFALALYNKLVKQTNLRVFLDQSATGIPLGVEWGPYFFRALSCSTLVVPLVSVAGVLQPWTKDSNGQYPILKKVDNVLIEHQAALGFYQLHRSGQGNSEMSRVKCILPLFLGSPSNYDEIQFTLCGDIPDSISLGTQASGKSLCQTTGMTFAEGFFDKTVKSTWTECSNVNGKKLSNLNGQNDEEKLAALCCIIEEEVQKLNPYQPIANSQFLVKLCCRVQGHNKQQILDVCSDHGLLCQHCFHNHYHSGCNIRPVKLVDIVEKWDTAHKNLETLQEQFNRIRSNIEKDFPQTSFAQDPDLDVVFSELRQRFAFFSDKTADEIAKSLKYIEKEMEPLLFADISTSFDGVKLTVLNLHERVVPEVTIDQQTLLNRILGDLLSSRNGFQLDKDRDLAVWNEMRPVDGDFYDHVKTRRMVAFDDVLREIDAKLRKFADKLKSADDFEGLKLDLALGSFEPHCPYTRPNPHPKHSYEQFGRDFFEHSVVSIPDADTWSWSPCGATDANVRAMLLALNGPFPQKLLQHVDDSEVRDTEFQFKVSGLSLTVLSPLIAVKLYCFFESTCLFVSESILQRPSLVPINPGFSENQTLLPSESHIVHSVPRDHDGAPISVKLKFKHLASVKHRQFLFVLHQDTGNTPSAADQGIASVAIGLEHFFFEEPKLVKLPLFNRTADVDCNGDVLGLKRSSALWTSEVANPDKLAFELSVVCLLEFQGILIPQDLHQHEHLTTQSLSFKNTKQFLEDCSVQTYDTHSDKIFYMELVCHKTAIQHQHSEVKFHIVDLSCASYLPVVFSGHAILVCNSLYQISAIFDWSVSENLCIIVEHHATYLPVCRLKVLKQHNSKDGGCPLLCMQHPDPSSTSVLIGSCQKSPSDEDLERFIPEFVNWRFQFIRTASDLVFEGRHFGFERSKQLGCWVSFFESASYANKEELRVNITNGTFDVVFDAADCVCPVHQTICDRVLTCDPALLEARRIFVCAECLKSGQSQESANSISDVASGGFSFVWKAVHTQLSCCDPSWKLLKQLHSEISSLNDYDIAAELEALQMGLDTCLSKVQAFVRDVASKSIPPPNVLQALPASDVSLIYQWMDAVCSQRAHSVSRVTPYLFTGFSGVVQLGYAEILQPKLLGFIQSVRNDKDEGIMVWQLLNTDKQAGVINLYELAFDINFEVCTRGYVNSSARKEAARIFVKHDFESADVSSNKSLTVGFEVNVKHKTLHTIQQRDISIIAWLRQSLIPDVSIMPRMFTFSRPKESAGGYVDISDHDIDLVNEQVIALFSASKSDQFQFQATDVSKVSYNTACIIHSISNDEVFDRLVSNILHVFPNPDVMLDATKTLKTISLLSMSFSDAFVSLPLSKLEPVEKRVLAIASRIIFSQTSGMSLKLTGLLNDAGYPMTLGSDLKSRLQTHTYYCSRNLGEAAIPGSDGQCGPNDGPQCTDCKGAQTLYMAKQPSTSASSFVEISDGLPSYASIHPYTMQTLHAFNGDYIKLRKNVDEKCIVCTVIPDEMCSKDSIRLSPRTCAKLRLRLGDSVKTEICKVSLAKRIMYRSDGSVASAHGLHPSNTFLQNCVVSVGETLRIQSSDGDCSFQIVCTDPEGICIVTLDTEMLLDSSVFEDIVNVDAVTSIKGNPFPSCGDLICLHRTDGSTQTLLRRRATTSRDASAFVQPHVSIKATDILTVVRDPVENDHEERFVFVRTSSGAEGYVQVQYVVRSPSPEGSHPTVKSHIPSLQSSVPAATAASGHFGEWRAIDEKARYSAAGERLGDISKYCCKPDFAGFEGAECFHLLLDTEVVCKSNHWSCCGSTMRQSTCTRSSPGLHTMCAYSGSRVQCYRCSIWLLSSDATLRFGPSPQTGVTECSACGLCATCCSSVSFCFGDLSRVALVISGASGPCAFRVNGVFYATDELSGGQCVYIKRNNPDVCVHFWAATGQWVVAASGDKGKNSNGWACIKHVGGLESASSLATWKVTANGIFGDQPDVRVRIQEQSERRKVLPLPSGLDSAFRRMLQSHTFCVGDRVQRGPDWKWKSQDKGGTGTVVEMLDSDGWVGVKWDHQASGKYRSSEKAGGFDLKPLSEIFPPMKVGDTVQRALDWNWGEQDKNGNGTVTSTLDDEGWIHVRWNSGGNNKYRYSEQAGGHDIQLCGNSVSSAASVALVQPSLVHTGSWRELKKLRYYCSRENQMEGPLCEHEGIVTENHWTCCGEQIRSSSCKRVGASNAPLFLSPGTSVKVQGMKSATWLNGAHGKVQSFDEKTSRYNVLIVAPPSAVEQSKGTPAALKRENLEMSSLDDKSGLHSVVHDGVFDMFILDCARVVLKKPSALPGATFSEKAASAKGIMGMMHQVFDTRCFSSMISGERNWDVLSKQCSDQTSRDFFAKVLNALQKV